MDNATPHTIKPNATMVDTLKAMRKAALDARRDLTVRGLVEKICENVAQGDYAGEVLAIYYWVCRNIRYMRDPPGVEMVKIPRKLLETRAGDCDDIATLLASMLMLAGNTVRFAVAGFTPHESYGHVYVEVVTPHGVIAVDPVANRDTGKMLRDIRHRKTFPVSEQGAMDAGVGRAPALSAKDHDAPMRHVGPGGGNVYSVYDYDRGLYRYYEGEATPLPSTGRFRRPDATGALGAPPEQYAAPLPASARAIGEGEVARGVLASTTVAPSALIPSSKLAWFAVGAGAGLLAAKLFSTRK